MVKRILLIVLAVVLVAGLGVGGWFLLRREVTYNGSVENSHKVTLTLSDRTFYDVYIPNEAVLMETDEYSIYRYDLLTVAVQEAEPMETDFKACVDGRWVSVESKDKWLVPTLYGFEHEEPYTYTAEYEYLTYINEDGEEVAAVWNDGPPPYATQAPTIVEGTEIYDIGDYVIYSEELLVWKDAVDQMMARLCLKTNSYIPHYYNDGRVFYATIGEYTVGCVHFNYNVQYTVLARGTQGTREALAILTKGLTG